MGFEGVLIDDSPVHIRRDIGSCQRRLGRRVAHVFKVDLHRTSVEFLAVAEGHVVAQVEGVGFAVRRDVPGLGQPGRNIPVLVLVHQTVEQNAPQPLRVAV